MLKLIFKYSLTALILIIIGKILWFGLMIRFYNPELLVSAMGVMCFIVGIRYAIPAKNFEYEPQAHHFYSVKEQADILANEYGLTEAELRIWVQLNKGHSNAEIAEIVHVSPNTVKTHISAILQKTGLKNRTQIVLLFSTKM